MRCCLNVIGFAAAAVSLLCHCRYKLTAAELKEAGELIRSRQMDEAASSLPSAYYEPPQYYYTPPYVTALPEVRPTALIQAHISLVVATILCTTSSPNSLCSLHPLCFPAYLSLLLLFLSLPLPVPLYVPPSFSVPPSPSSLPASLTPSSCLPFPASLSPYHSPSPSPFPFLPLLLPHSSPCLSFL